MSVADQKQPDNTGMSSFGMTLLDHFEELRDRVVRSFIAVVVTTLIVATFADQIFKFLLAPYGEAVIITRPTEGISIYFRVALIGGLILAMPYLIYHVIMFVLPGLEKAEKRYVMWGVPAATFLFLVGASFAWFLMLPTAINFLKYWQVEIFKPMWQADEYIPFVTSLVFWIGVSFETPLIIFIMAKVGVVTPRFLAQQWRFAIVIVAIMAAMITPTVDPFNMALVMGPLMGLYGLSILLAYLA
jgi:sec-independent protein translocase protein TatC